MAVLDLDRAKWQTFKTTNNLSKSSFFNKADVGPNIDAFQKAVAEYRTAKSEKSLMKVFGKATDLQKAFKKFLDIKEGKNELTNDSRAKIEKWASQLDTVQKTLAVTHEKFEAKLKQGDYDEMDKTLKECLPF